MFWLKKACNNQQLLGNYSNGKSSTILNSNGVRLTTPENTEANKLMYLHFSAVSQSLTRFLLSPMPWKQLWKIQKKWKMAAIFKQPLQRGKNTNLTIWRKKHFKTSLVYLFCLVLKVSHTTSRKYMVAHTITLSSRRHWKRKFCWFLFLLTYF